MIEGFRFTMDAKENNEFVPMSRRMFFRHSMVECLPTHASLAPSNAGDASTTSFQEDRVILELLLRQNEVRGKLVKIMQKIHNVSRTRCLFLILPHAVKHNVSRTRCLFLILPHAVKP